MSSTKRAGRVTARTPRKGAVSGPSRSRNSMAPTAALRRMPLGALRVFVAVGEHLSFCSVALVDFVQTGVHAAVRFGRGQYPGLETVKLFDDWLVPVGQPAQLERLGRVHDAQDLKRHRLLHTIGEPWSAWLLGDYDDTDWPAAGHAFDDSLAVVRAAEAGHGLALARWSLIAAEVAAGRLAIASSRVVRHSGSYWFACPPQNLKLDKVVRLREWLLAKAAEFPPPPNAA